MAYLTESAAYDAGIYQLETTDKVQGGASGTSNVQAKALANRTTWLKSHVDTLEAALKVSGAKLGIGVGTPSEQFSVLGDAALTLGATHISRKTMVKAPAMQIAGGSDSELTPASLALLTPGVGVSTQRGAELYFCSSRATPAALEAGTRAAVLSGDQIGAVYFTGDDGVDLRSIGATLVGVAESTWSATSNQARLVFSTTASGSTTPTERVRIEGGGNVGVGIAPQAKFHVAGPVVLDAFGSPQFVATKFSTGGVAWSSMSSSPSLVLNGAPSDRPEIVWIRGARSYPEFSIREHSVADTGAQFFAGNGSSSPMVVWDVSSTTQSWAIGGATQMWLDAAGSLSIGAASAYGARFAVSGGALPTQAVGIGVSSYLGAGRLVSGDTSNTTAAVNAYLDTSTVEVSAGATNATGISMSGVTSPIGASLVRIFTAGSERARVNGSGQLLVGATAATGDAKVQSPNGIRIGGTASADVNTLDAYEEGTFTAVAVGTTTAGTGTYTTQVGRYQRVGNRVAVQISIVWTAHTGTGNIVVSGLPFVAATVANNLTAVAVAASGLTFTGQLQGVIGSASTQITLSATASGSASAPVAMDAAASIYITATYEV